MAWKPQRIFGLFLTGCLVLAPCLWAATGDLQLTVDSLELRIARLEAALARLETADYLRDASVEYVAGRGAAVYLPRRPQSAPTVEPPAAAVPENDAEALEISGFLEGLGQIVPHDGRRNQVRLNQAEIDLGRELHPRVRADLGLYYDGAFTLAAATVGVTALSSGEDVKSARVLRDLCVSAGQFDVPFGLGYLTTAPLDRPGISMPRPVAATIGGWNDTGVMALFGGRFGTLNVYGVKGFETRLWNSDDPLPANVTDDDERWLTVLPAQSGGLRLNLPLWPHGDGGLSLARGWTRTGEASQTFAGLHLQHRGGLLTLKAEALLAATAQNLRPQHVRGTYLEAVEHLGAPFLVQRVELWQHGSALPERGLNLGMGWSFAERLQARAEYGWESTSRTGELALQFVAGL